MIRRPRRSTLFPSPPLSRSGRKNPPMSADLTDLVRRLGQPRVLVVGDLMLDRYVWGNAARISQEAPVLLLHADRREERLGGAPPGAPPRPPPGAPVAPPRAVRGGA